MTATAAVGLMTAPVVAAAQTAPVPAIETVQGSASHCDPGNPAPGETNCRRHFSIFIPAAVVAAIILGILAATRGNRGDRPITAG
jgi:hypothetical protein